MKTKNHSQQENSRPMSSIKSGNPADTSTLSDKIEITEGRFVIHEDYIKEFIKRDTELIKLYIKSEITHKELWERRNKLAGDKLT